MTPLPKRRISKRRQGKRRAAKKLLLSNLVVCSQCNTAKKPHMLCLNCGYYNGRQIVVPKVKKTPTKSGQEKKDKKK